MGGQREGLAHGEKCAGADQRRKGSGSEDEMGRKGRWIARGRGKVAGKLRLALLLRSVLVEQVGHL